MSGPIIRKYGFPNFEKIFGEREIKHGAPDDKAPAQPSTPDKSSAGSPPGANATEAEKQSEDSAQL